MAVRLRFRTAPVAPLMGMPESSSARREVVAVARGVAQLVRQEPGAPVLLCTVLASQAGLALETELGHGVGDGVVEAAVQRPELRRGERGIALEREVGDG